MEPPTRLLSYRTPRSSGSRRAGQDPAPHEHEAQRVAIGPAPLLACPGVISGWGVWVRFETFSFGSIRVDGMTYRHDLVIDRGAIRKRKKRVSKQYRDAYGQTLLSTKENIPWRCRRVVVGTGAEGRLPVMDEVQNEAQLRKVDLVSLPTQDAIAILNGGGKDTNAILHVTC